MSYWSELYAGDAAQIARAVNDGRAVDGQAVLAHAVLAGVVPDATGELPNTPNLLTDLACSITKADPVTFAHSIVEHLGGDPDPAEATSGVYKMSDEWIALFAALADEQLRLVAQRWAKECDPGSSDDAPQVTALVKSIHEVEPRRNGTQR